MSGKYYHCPHCAFSAGHADYCPSYVKPEPEHTPCCSSHGVPMSCERYRRTHFVEVRPCCSADAQRLETETETP